MKEKKMIKKIYTTPKNLQSVLIAFSLTTMKK